MSKRDWTDYLKLTPVIYAALVVIGFVKLYLYYKMFNINIGDYLELSEILVFFLDDLFIYILVFAYLTFKFLRKYNESSNIQNQDGGHFLSDEKTYRKKLKIGIISLLVIAALSTIFYFLLPLKSFLIFIPVVILIIWAIIHYYTRQLVVNQVIKNKSTYELIHFSYLVILVVCYMAISEAETNKLYGYAYADEIEYKDQIIKSDSTQFFIGKTKNYIFYYNKEEHKTTAFPLKDVGYIK